MNENRASVLNRHYDSRWGRDHEGTPEESSRHTDMLIPMFRTCQKMVQYLAWLIPERSACRLVDFQHGYLLWRDVVTVE